MQAAVYFLEYNYSQHKYLYSADKSYNSRMKKLFSEKIVFVLLLVSIIVTSGCSSDNYPKKGLSDNYRISPVIAFDKNLCSSYGSDSNSSSGVDTGFKIILDDGKGQPINGSGTIDFGESSTSSSILASSAQEKKYICENTASDTITISAYSKGFAPVTLKINTPMNQLSTVKMTMSKSGTTYSQCSDMAFLKEQLREHFGLSESDYTIYYSECNPGRGGYFKTGGVYKDGSKLELYYHWGSCSSGGSDCGFDVCINTRSNEFLEEQKNTFCDQLSSRMLNDGTVCDGDEYDNTKSVKDSCLSGAYDGKRTLGSESSFSIIQNISKCKNSVSIGNRKCMDI